MSRFETYIEHWEDIIGNPSCWGDHFAAVAGVVCLAMVLETYYEIFKNGAWKRLSVWEIFQLICCGFLPIWWFFVFTSLYLGGEN